MKCFIGSDGYYEGAPRHQDDAEVIKRPSPYHVWGQTGWVFNRGKWLAEEVRPKRNALLTACDYTQLADAPLSAEQKTAYTTYRQALRDLPASADYENFAWPEAPDA